MALKKVYFGSVGPFVYDDALPVNDPDGDFAGEDHKAMTTNGQMRIEQGPVQDEEVIRLVDLDSRLLSSISVVNIDNPTELNTLAGTLATLILAYQIVGATVQDKWTIYAYDASGPAVNAPYIMDADGVGDERWIAITGKYASQDLNIPGNITISTINLTGGQIVFPAAAVPSANVNTLDDYKEGIFIPVLTFGANAVGMTYSLQTAQYTKIGRIVAFSIQIILTNKGISVGAAVISGLPFASLVGNYSAFSLRLQNISFADFPQGLNATGATTIALEEITNAGVQTALNNNNFANNSTLLISGTYHAA